MTPEQVSNLGDVTAIYGTWGWVGVAAALVHLLLKLWRSGAVDSWLSIAFPGLRWDARSRWWRLGIVFALATAATALTGIATAGQSWWVALTAGVLAGVGSIGMHEARETAAKASADFRPPPSESASIRTRLPPVR